MLDRPNILTIIREILRANPDGISIIDVARRAGISRNTAAKHLVVLLASGEVDVQVIGSAKIYSLSGRLPLSSIMDSTSDYIAVVDERFTLVNANRNLLRLLAVKRSELIGQSVIDVVSSILSGSNVIATLDYIIAKFDQAVKGNQITDEMKTKIDGKDMYFSVKLVPTKFDNGEPGVTVILENTTEKTLAQKAVVDQRDFLGKVIESLVHPFYVIDANDYSVKIANKAANFGPLTKDSRCHALTHKRDKPCSGLSHPCPLKEVKRTRKPIIVEHAHHDVESDAIKYFEVHGIPILDASGNIVQMIEYNIDISDYKNVEQEIESRDAKFHSLFENSPIGIVQLGLDGVILDVNEALTRFSGYSKEELLNLHLEDISYPQDYITEKSLTKEILAGVQDSYSIEKRFIHKEGYIVWGRVSVSVSRDKNGIIEFIVNMVEDITDERTMNDIQKIQYNLISSLAKQLSWHDAAQLVLSAALKVEGVDCGGMYSVDESTGAMNLVAYEGLSEDFVKANKHFKADTPQVNAIMRGMTVFDSYTTGLKELGIDETREGLRALAVVPILDEGKVIASLNLSSRTHDEIPENSRRFLETLALQVAGVTGRIRTEEKLRENEKRFRTTFENSGIGMTVVGTDDIIQNANPRYSKMVGYDLDELKQMRISDFTHPEDAAIDHSLFKEIIEGERESYQMEKRYIRKDGNEIWVNLTVSCTRDDSGNVGFILGMVEDITEQKNAVRALKESESKFRRFIEQSTNGIALTDENGLIVEWNASQERITEITRGKAIGLPIWEVIINYLQPKMRTREATQNLKEQVIRAIEEGKNPIFDSHDTFSLVHTDGSTRVIQNSVFPIKTGSGHMLGSIIRDITEQHRVETEIRQSEKKYRTLYENMPDGFARCDRSGKFIEFNDAYLEIVGYSSEELQELTFWDISPMEWHESEQKVIDEEIVPKGYGDVFEKEYERRDGTLVPVEVRGSAELDEEGQMIGTWAIVRDISRRKQAELQLREREASYASILRAAPTGIGVMKNRKIQWVSEILTTMLGYNSNELIGKTARNLYLTEEEYERVGEKKYSELQEKGIGSVETQLVHRDGRTIDVLVNSSPIDPHDFSKGVTFTVLDITDWKRARIALEKSEAKYRHLFNTSRDGIAFTTMDGFFTDANPAFVKMVGYDLEKLGTMTYYQLTAEDYLDEEAKIHQTQVMKRGYADEYEKEYIRKDGTVFPALVRTWLLKDDENNAMGIVALVRDITESKKIIEALKDNEEQYRMTVDSMSDPIFVVDKELRIILNNPAFERWCKSIGVKENTIGKTINEAFPFFQMKLINDYHHLLKTGEALHTVDPIVVARKEHSIEMSKIPISRTGEVAQILTIVRTSHDSGDSVPS
ncbi:MAG: PAS domain S-box protein [Candidatus Thorarchaeota archaeon]|jgi:PAS domain S-box-containing protein